MLGMEREALIDVSAAIATRDEASLERALILADRFSPPEAVAEVLLQSHLFVGFPIALEALMLWRRIHPEDEPVQLDEAAADWPTRGEAVCRTVYGRSYDKLRANVAALHPDFDQWMVTGGYGRVLGRPNLSLKLRELCTVALLAVWDSPRQLHSHLRGAGNAGATASEVESALQIAYRHLSPEKVARVAAVWSKVREKQESGGDGRSGETAGVTGP